MDAKQIRGMSADDRKKELHALLREQFNLRMQKATGQLANGAKLGKVRRDIARLLTVAHEERKTK